MSKRTAGSEPDRRRRPPSSSRRSSPRVAEIAKLRQELTDLRRQFSDLYPEVVRTKAELAALEKEQQQENAAAPPPAPAADSVDSKERFALGLAAAQRELAALKEEE